MKQKNEQFSYSMIAIHIVLHVIAVYTITTFSWTNFFAFALSHIIISGFGIVIGYHRLLCHRQFFASDRVKNTLALLGALGMQGGP